MYVSSFYKAKQWESKTKPYMVKCLIGQKDLHTVYLDTQKHKDTQKKKHTLTYIMNYQENCV